LSVAARLRPHIALIAATGVVLLVVAIVLARPYDGALNRDAASGTQWTDHVVRVEVALARAEGRNAPFGWVIAADQGFPPLIHWLSVPLGDALGRGAGVVERFGILWLLILVAATGVLGEAVTGDRTAGALAAASLATFPAIHGTALGYFYDLPMTALLFAAAAVLLTRRHVAAVGLAAGVLFVLGCAGKWTALALAPPLVLGVLLTRRSDQEPGDGRRRWGAAALAAATAGIGVAGFLAVSSKSLLAMASTGYGVEQSGSTLGEALYRVLFLGGVLLGETLVFLPVRLVLGALGPALAVAIAMAILAWAIHSRAGAAMIGCVIVGDVLVIWRLFPALNDRWLISIVPVLAIAAAAGIRALPWARARGPAAIALLAVGLVGTWDFHHGDTHARAVEATGENADWNELRAWSAASSTEPQLGWARGDYREGTFLANREAIWTAIVRCRARDVLIEESVSGPSDAPWWRYRDILHRLETSDASRHIRAIGGPEMTAPPREGDATAVALLRHERRDEDPSPPALLPGWTLRAVVPAWKDAPAVGLWTPTGVATCSAYDP
jgi:hypothetical protein